MVYLLKVTLAWALFLLLFEVMYKGSGRYSVNRLYLLLSLAIGLSLPWLPLPSFAPKVISSVAFAPQLAPSPVVDAPAPIVAPAIAQPLTTSPIENGFDLAQVIFLIYITGMVMLIAKFLFDLGNMIRLIAQKPTQLIAGHPVIITGRRQAPYSFMKWIFIGDPANYQGAELEYIVRHEAAHGHRRHWVDLLLLQIVSIVLWFHPLVWRYRYLLQLQHEFEADELAARGDVFSYGHFLLTQTMLKGAPSIAHSFQFSPIKNRIKMLTRKHSSTKNARKYLLIVPALFACTFLMAKATGKMPARINKTVEFNGNSFAWRSTDTLSYDRETKTAKLMPAAWPKNQVIFKMNTEPVYQNQYLNSPAGNNFPKGFVGYVTEQFKEAVKNTADSQTVLMVANIVVDKQGKVVYCERYYQKRLADHQINYPKWQPYPTREPALDKIVDRIVAGSPQWLPGRVDGKPVNTQVIYTGGDGSGGC